jgi:hypothetical protein
MTEETGAAAESWKIAKRLSALPQHVACRRWHEAREQPQQRGLAGTIGTGQHQRLSGVKAEGDRLEDEPLAAEGRDIP